MDTLWKSIAVFSVLFLTVTSYWHILRNAFIKQGQAEDADKFRLHKAAMVLFAVVVCVYVAGILPQILPEIVAIGVLVLLIHGFRICLDFADGRDSRTVGVVIRHAFDAAANFLTLIFVVAVDAKHDSVLVWPALLLSAGLIGKELYYRFWLDPGVRRENARKTTQGGSGAATSPQFVGYHALSNGFKSLAYFLAGYAALYLCLATISQTYDHLILGSADRTRFFQALTFSVKNIQLVLGGTFDPLLFVLMVLEFGGAFFLLLALSQSPLNRN